VAAIGYAPLEHIDLSKHPEQSPSSLWDQLAPSQKASLRRVAYKMKGGDIIYVREGGKVVGRGVIKGRPGDSAYFFDSGSRIGLDHSRDWRHHVPVEWDMEFQPVSKSWRDQLTVLRLEPEDVAAIEKLEISEQKIEKQKEAQGTDFLSEEAYPRVSKEISRIIIPRHKKLSNELREWLRAKHKIDAVQEEKFIDVRFEKDGRQYLAELKVCYGIGTRKSIREALAQLIEYNYYPKRDRWDQWFVVLDEQPSSDDKKFIDTLRNEMCSQLRLGWRTGEAFSF
jgi:hypothetical protein